MDNSVPTKMLRFKHFELRMRQYALIEQRLKDYLGKICIDYDALPEDCRYATLVGALLAIENAIFNGVMEYDTMVDDKFSDEFKAFLQTLMPLHDFYETLTWIEHHSETEVAQQIQRRFVEEAGYPRHEAYLRALSISVAGYLSVNVNEGTQERLDEALYCCYLHAQKEFFMGDR